MATERESNRYVIYNGANDKLTPDDVGSALTCMPDCVFLQLSLPEETVRAALLQCERKSIPVYCYTGHGAVSPINLSLNCVKLLVSDERGCEALAGVTEFKQSSLVTNCVRLAGSFRADNYIIKLKSGTTLTYNNMLHFLYTPPCEVSPCDPATAFDTFAAAAAFKLIDGGNLDQAAQFAGIIEAMTLEGPGASESCPRSGDIESFKKAHGIE